MNFGKHSKNNKQQNITSKKKKVEKKLGLYFLRILLISILIIGVIGASITLGAVQGVIESAPPISADSLIPQGEASIIYDQEGNEIQRLTAPDKNRIPVTIDQMPEHLQNAVIAIEDERFWDHNGIDLRGILRSIFRNATTGSTEGASTITQQLIKNNVLSFEQTFERKIQEQYLALKIENEVSKELILENYLNTIALGKGVNGVQVASEYYFNKDVEDLTLSESTVLAAIIKGPAYFNPVDNPENNETRRLLVLDKMLELNMITESEYDEAVNDDVYERIEANQNAIEETNINSYFVDAVYLQVLDDLTEQKGLTAQEAQSLLYGGGLKIYITQDSDIQEIVDNAINDEQFYPANSKYYLSYRLTIQHTDGTETHYDETHIAEYANTDGYYSSTEEAEEAIESFKEETLKEGETPVERDPELTIQPQSSMVIIDHSTGYVKALAGGRGEKESNLSFNRATQATRQPGSTFKVLAAFLPALDTGTVTLATAIDDVPTTFNIGDTTYSPENWYINQTYPYKGLSTVRRGLSYSMNIVAVKTLEMVGTRTSFDYLLDLGFTTLIDPNDDPVTHDMNLSTALGGLTNGVTNLELTAAYGAIANGGEYIKPILYTQVLDNEDNVILENTTESKRVIKDSTAYLLTSAMEDVFKGSPYGTAASAKFYTQSMGQAGKTGTSQHTNDLWFSGFTPYYVCSIWQGYDIQKTQTETNNHKLMWKEVMGEIHKDLETKYFDKPSSITSAYICKSSGKLAGDLCKSDVRNESQVRSEYFASTTVPTETCDVHVMASICTKSGALATEYCPDDCVETKAYIRRPIPLSEEVRSKVEDAKYELTITSEDSYCHIHTAYSEEEEEDDDTSNNKPNKPNKPDDDDDSGNNGNNGNGNNGNGDTGNDNDNGDNDNDDVDNNE